MRDTISEPKDQRSRGEPISLPPLLNELYAAVAWQDKPVYLVGGAVRDILLGLPIHDFDFAVQDEAISLAFRVADILGKPAYVLDRERDSGRVVLQGNETTLDFSRFRGRNLAADLRERDFTINAMALPAGADNTADLIDPCDGQGDLLQGVISQTHRSAISDDPVRALRAVRLGLQLDFKLSPETAKATADAASLLDRVSKERVRDEFLKLLHLDAPDLAIGELGKSGLLGSLVPQISALEDIVQTEPHHEHVLAHTIRVMHWLAALEVIIQGRGVAGRQSLDLVSEALSPYVQELHKHFSRSIDGGLDGYLLLRLGALFHDVGKARSMTIDPAGGRIRFIGHEKVGAEIANQLLRNLRMSNEAVSHVGKVVLGHMRPLMLAANPSLSRRAIHRYFKATGRAGLDICLVSLADRLAILDAPGEREPADSALESLTMVVSQLYAHYWEHFDEVIRPTPVVSGRDLMDSFELSAGPEVGRLLRLIEEAQAAGEVTSRQEALSLAGRSLRAKY